METSLFELAAKDGLWAALYVFLFIYTLFDSRRREKELQQTIRENQKIISETVEKLNIVEDMQKDIKDIKAEVCGR